MRITLNHLKKAWNDNRLKKIHTEAFAIGSDKLFNLKISGVVQNLIDAIWSDDHDRAVAKRNKFRQEYCQFKHVFISEICDVAVDEYKTVCNLLRVKNILLVGLKRDKKFFRVSRKLLKQIPGIKIISLEID
jgi:hypothetical protein